MLQPWHVPCQREACFSRAVRRERKSCSSIIVHIIIFATYAACMDTELTRSQRGQPANEDPALSAHMGLLDGSIKMNVKTTHLNELA